MINQGLPSRDVRLWQDSQEITRTISANYTLTDRDDHLLVDSTSGNVTVTLPKIRNGKKYSIVHQTGSNLLTIQPTSPDTIVLPFGTTISIFKGSSLNFKAINNSWVIE